MLAVVRCAVAVGHAPLPPAARAGRIGRSAKVRIKELHYAARRATSPRPPFCLPHPAPFRPTYPPFTAPCRPAPRTSVATRVTAPLRHSLHPPRHTSLPVSPIIPASRPHALAPAATLATVPLHHSPHPPRHTAFVCTRPQPYPHAAILTSTLPAQKNPEWLRSLRNRSGS